MSLEELRKKAEAGDPAALLELADALDKAERFSEATDILSRAANRGSIAARCRVGARLLVGLGAPNLPQDGIRLISDCAGRDAEAAHLLGVIFALGAYVRQDWGRALDLLQRSAELGSASARSQLALLAEDSSLAAESAVTPGPAIWRRLRRSIDLAAWRTPRVVRKLSDSPLVGAMDNFVSPAICAWLIGRSQGRLRRAEVYTGAEASVGEGRTNTAAGFNLIETDFINVLVQARIAAAVGVRPSQLEGMTILHYSVGEVFTDHFDFVDPRSPNAKDDIARMGQRIITFLIYLNEGYEGGETDFPRLGFGHKGRTGDAMFFRNTSADDAPDLRTLHAGRAPTSGEKWLITQFIRGRPIVPGTVRPH